MPIPSPKALLGIVTLAAGVALAWSLAWLDAAPLLRGELSRGQMLGRDFVNMWTASTLAWQGDFATIFDVEAFNAAFRRIMDRDLSFNNFPYPPSGLWVSLPWSALPYEVSLAAWLALTLLLFLVAACAGRPAPVAHGALLLLAPATAVTIAAGHNGFLTGALLIGGLRLLGTRPVLAGILLGLLSYKPHLGILLPFVLAAGGHRRAFLAATATVLVLVAGSALAMGTDIWRLYLEHTAAVQRGFLEHGTGMWQFMTPSAFMSGRLLGLPLPACYALQAATALAALAGAVWAARRGVRLDLMAGIVTTGTFLATPYAYNYDMPALTAAVVMAAPAAGRSPSGAAALALAWLLPSGLLLLNAGGRPIGPLILGLLFAVLLRTAAQENQISSSSRSWPVGGTTRL